MAVCCCKSVERDLVSGVENTGVGFGLCVKGHALYFIL